MYFAPESSRTNAVLFSVHHFKRWQFVPLLVTLTLAVSWDGVCSEKLLFSLCKINK